MKIISTVWWVLVNLVAVAVIFAMFHIAKSPFETSVICALVLIYASVVGSFAILGRALMQKGNMDLARFIEIAKSLHLSTELYQEALEEDREEFQKTQLKFSINVGFNSLFALIAILYLIYAVAS